MLDPAAAHADYRDMGLTVVAALLTLPGVAFLGANLIEWASGTQGNTGVFGSSFEGWSAAGLTLVVVGGPLLAFLLSTIGSLRVRAAAREQGGLQATFDLRMPRERMIVAAVSVLLVGGTVAYWLAENWPCSYGNYFSC